VLKDSRKIYGAGEQIKWVSHQGFADSHPDVAKMFNAWHMTPEQLSQLMLTIEKAGDPDEGAAQWIDENRKLVDGWLMTGGDN